MSKRPHIVSIFLRYHSGYCVFSVGANDILAVQTGSSFSSFTGLASRTIQEQATSSVQLFVYPCPYVFIIIRTLLAK